MPATIGDAAGAALLAAQAWALAVGLTWRAAHLAVSALARQLPGCLLEVRGCLGGLGPPWAAPTPPPAPTQTALCPPAAAAPGPRHLAASARPEGSRRCRRRTAHQRRRRRPAAGGRGAAAGCRSGGGRGGRGGAGPSRLRPTGLDAAAAGGRRHAACIPAVAACRRQLPGSAAVFPRAPAPAAAGAHFQLPSCCG